MGPYFVYIYEIIKGGVSQVECAAIDNEGGMIYIVLTTGEIKRHKITELEEQKKTRGSVIFKPDFKVFIISRVVYLSKWTRNKTS